ncbi:MAG: hypothetical protein JNM17_21685 [Archangium sp.]|nr:hypothetical protein [Archangium sp.]
MSSERELRDRIEALSAELKERQASLEHPPALEVVVKQRAKLEKLAERREQLVAERDALARKLDTTRAAANESQRQLAEARERISTLEGTNTLENVGAWSWNRLASLLGASMDLLYEFFAMFTLTMVASIASTPERRSFEDLGIGAMAGALGAWCLFVLIKRIVKPARRTVEVKNQKIEVPSISLWHFVYDALFLSLALTTRTPAMVVVFVPVPALLIILRGLFWTRRHTID